MLLPLLAFGCGATGWEPTSIDELRVVTITTDPAEALPGERVEADAYIADPDGDPSDIEVMFWTCLYVDDETCAEPLFASELEEWVTIGTGSGGRFSTAREIPSQAWNYFPDDADRVTVQVFLLACEEGLCPQFERVRAGMDARGIDEEIAAELARPDLWLANLPMEGVALATRAYPVSNRDPGLRNVNPEFDARFPEALTDAINVRAGGIIDLIFQCRDPNGESVYAFPVTTAGQFDDRKVKCEDEQVRLFLEAPAAAGEGHVWVVFDDRDGGLAVYDQAVVVR
ncbi:MAG: hypothetical protein H6742_20270 [Alphaproteobacteria bacterium]|nr:hypothetical protein [Alphaproteobacteria bacterium]